MCAWRACAWRGTVAAILLLVAVLAAADYERRSDMSPMPFVMGSRYGRSSPPKLVVPRNDRFFMGSRYGKRSESHGGRSTSLWTSNSGTVSSGESESGTRLRCEYTGVFSLYRCVTHHKRDHYDARSADEAGAREEQ